MDEAKTSFPEKVSWTKADLRDRSVVKTPFLHATFNEVLPVGTGDAVLTWLETEAPWRLKQTDFYEQFELDLRDVPCDIASFLASESVLELVRSEMEAIFDARFGNEISVVCHKLVEGHRIGIHNDYLDGEETHRLIVQLNRGLSDENGGFLMLFGSDDVTDVRHVLRPLHRGGFAFAISKDSFHAVSKVHSGVRYSLIYSLRVVLV